MARSGANSVGATLAPTLDRTHSATAARPQVKISDFGLARHIVDTESLALTAAGALVGTPHYMAPEQWTGRAVDPRTDVYAMGATLFHLLAGQPPFTAETREELGLRHCNEPPPRLTSLDLGVSEAAERVVERALSKQPDDRYHDAGAMLRDIEAVLHGQPTDLAIHPRLPECDPHRVVQFEFRWELESSPRQLWPLVTNTDRLDRAIGFAPVTYKTRYEPGRGVRTFAEGRKAGMVEVGEEHPYEWVEPRRMGVVREYSQGPFRWMVSTVELIPRPGGGTTLIHRLRLEPSSWKIRVGSRWGVGVSLRKSLERVYRRIDATVKTPEPARIVRRRSIPSKSRPRCRPSRRQRLERLLDRLVEQGIDAAVVDRLGEHLASGAAQEVARIRPLALAERWGLDPDQVVARLPARRARGLARAALGPALPGLPHLMPGHRHAPRDRRACPLRGLPSRLPARLRQLDRADLPSPSGDPRGRSGHLLHRRTGALAARARPGPRRAATSGSSSTSSCRRARTGCAVRSCPGRSTSGSRSSATIRRWEIDLGSAQPPERLDALRTGGQILILTNPHSRELVIRVERTATRNDALTAARATSMALFRELFPGEVLAPASSRRSRW